MANTPHVMIIHPAPSAVRLGLEGVHRIAYFLLVGVDLLTLSAPWSFFCNMLVP